VQHWIFILFSFVIPCQHSLTMLVCNPLGIDIFEVILFLVEFVPYLVAVVVGLVALVWSSTANKWLKLGSIIWVPAMIAVMISSTFLCSWEDAYRRGYDLSLPSLRSALESYITTGEGDVRDILESNRYAPTFGLSETNYIVKDLLKHTIFHLDDHNVENIDEGYNKGNDWFAATLGETMIYTCGIYPTGEETLMEAQIHKLIMSQILWNSKRAIRSYILVVAGDILPSILPKSMVLKSRVLPFRRNSTNLVPN